MIIPPFIPPIGDGRPIPRLAGAGVVVTMGIALLVGIGVGIATGKVVLGLIIGNAVGILVGFVCFVALRSKTDVPTVGATPWVMIALVGLSALMVVAQIVFVFLRR